MWTSSHTSSYPADVQKRSYFTDGICGAGTDTACSGPNVPIPVGNSSARVGPNGTLTVPKGTALPKLVPLSRTP
jgi:hypothetical protein